MIVFAVQGVEMMNGRERYRSVDLLRGLAAAGMVGAHVSWALLAPEAKTGVWAAFDLLFGCVAPVYLALSGATLRHTLERDSRPHTLRRHARRMLRLLVAGLLLQVPILSIRQLFWNHDPREIAQIFDCNALHVIALAGLVVVTLARLLPLRGAVAIAAALALLLLFSEPLLSILLPNRALLAPPLRGLLGVQPLATFPLVPFALYPLVGFVLGPWLLSGESRPARSAWIATLGGCAIVAGFLLGGLFSSVNFWQNSPCYLLFRIGAVAVALALAQGWSLRPRGAVAPFVEWMGRSSLAIYVLHLLIVYDSPLKIGLANVWQGSLCPMAAALVSCGVLALTLCVLWCWLRLRREAPLVALALKGAFWAVFWGTFLAKP